jgi:periplasmic divalent cation tolerance protein
MTQATPDALVVLVTAPAEQAPVLARRLVQSALAACVNVLPAVRSFYTWEGEICDDGESLLVIKTRRALFEELRAAVVEMHPYEVPEVLALPVAAGHLPYLEWIAAVTRS